MRVVYGVPDEGNAFVMRMQWVLRVDCGMAQCEVNPCIWWKILCCQEHELVGNLAHAKGKGSKIVKDWVLLCSWTNGLRYIGTDEAVRELEAVVVVPGRGNLKVTLQGEVA